MKIETHIISKNWDISVWGHSVRQFIRLGINNQPILRHDPQREGDIVGWQFYTTQVTWVRDEKISFGNDAQVELSMPNILLGGYRNSGSDIHFIHPNDPLPHVAHYKIVNAFIELIEVRFNETVTVIENCNSKHLPIIQLETI